MEASSGAGIAAGKLGASLIRQKSDARIESLIEIAEKRGLIASLENSSEIGFDWHGNAMLQVIKK